MTSTRSNIDSGNDIKHLRNGLDLGETNSASQFLPADEKQPASTLKNLVRYIREKDDKHVVETIRAFLKKNSPVDPSDIKIIQEAFSVAVSETVSNFSALIELLKLRKVLHESGRGSQQEIVNLVELDKKIPVQSSSSNEVMRLKFFLHAMILVESLTLSRYWEKSCAELDLKDRYALISVVSSKKREMLINELEADDLLPLPEELASEPEQLKEPALPDPAENSSAPIHQDSHSSEAISSNPAPVTESRPPAYLPPTSGIFATPQIQVDHWLAKLNENLENLKNLSNQYPAQASRIQQTIDERISQFNQGIKTTHQMQNHNVKTKFF